MPQPHVVARHGCLQQVAAVAVDLVRPPQRTESAREVGGLIQHLRLQLMGDAETERIVALPAELDRSLDQGQGGHELAFGQAEPHALGQETAARANL